jgi:hypothetical protein
MNENMHWRLRPQKALDARHRSIASPVATLGSAAGTHGVAGEMTEFEVTHPPSQSAHGPGVRDGEPDRVGTCPTQAGRRRLTPLRFRPISGLFLGYRLLAPAGGLWQEPARLLRPFWADSISISGMLP